MNLIDGRQALDMLAETVREKGEDYVYVSVEEEGGPVCRYAYKGEPHCAVGHVFAKLGVPISEMEWSDDPQYKPYAQGTAELVAEHLGIDGIVEFTSMARRVLARFQSLQDNDVSWGRSLEITTSEFEDGIL